MTEDKLNRMLKRIPWIHKTERNKKKKLTCYQLWKTNESFHAFRDNRPKWDDQQFVDSRGFASFINNDICEYCGNQYHCGVNTFCNKCSSGSHPHCIPKEMLKRIPSGIILGCYTCDYCLSMHIFFIYFLYIIYIFFTYY